VASDSGAPAEEIVMFPTYCRSAFLTAPEPYVPGYALRASSQADRAHAHRSKPTIGLVVFLTHKNVRAEAILDAEGRWHCPTLPVLDRVLNALHEPQRSSGDDMPFGHAELIRVAAWLKGTARIERC
jgi:hypothetical protein